MFDESQGNHVVVQFQKKQLINELIDAGLHLSENDLMRNFQEAHSKKYHVKLNGKQKQKSLYLRMLLGHFSFMFLVFYTPINF